MPLLALESGGGTQDNADVARPPRDGVRGRRGYLLSSVYTYIQQMLGMLTE